MIYVCNKSKLFLYLIRKCLQLHQASKDLNIIINSLFFIIHEIVWLIFDFTVHLMKNNTAFTVVYTLYFLQLSIVTILCPGSSLLMLSYLVELVTGFPLIANVAVLSAICFAYCIVQISSLTSYTKLIFSKLSTLVLGILTMYAIVATSVYIVQTISKGNTYYNILVFGIIK